jgi:hypothetical protein
LDTPDAECRAGLLRPALPTRLQPAPCSGPLILIRITAMRGSIAGNACATTAAIRHPHAVAIGALRESVRELGPPAATTSSAT